MRSITTTLLFLLLFLVDGLFAQTSIILPNGTVIPSFTQANRPSANQVVGQLIYQTDGTAGLYVWSGSAWTAVSAGSGGGSGTVTAVTTTAPLSVTNGSTTPALSIAQANGSTSGFLSSTDWTAFNNKFTLPSLTSGSLLFSNGSSIAQNNNQLFWNTSNANLGIGTNMPNTSSILDLSSTTKGFLTPRMTKAQREAVASPAEGLIVYQTDIPSGYFHFQNGAWKRLIGGEITPHLVNNGLPETVQTFNYTGAMQTFTVPNGINVIKIEVRGAQGGDGVIHQPNVAIQYPPGAAGGSALGYFSVTPGQVLNIFVGQKPPTPINLSSNGQIIGGGYNGGGDSRADVYSNIMSIPGGGGGASDVRIGGANLSDRVIVGGGGAGSIQRAFGSTNYLGGVGGGLAGGNGACENGGCGNGATQSAGAALGQGASAVMFGAGGGGGGFYGGQAGSVAGATGGGGSGYALNSITTPVFTTGTNLGHGVVIISYGAYSFDTLTTLPYKIAPSSLKLPTYTSGVLFSNGSTTNTNSNLFWDNTNEKLGIRTNTPNSSLSVNSTSGQWQAADFGASGMDRVLIGSLQNRATIGAHTSNLSGWSNLSINPDGGNVAIGSHNPTEKLQVIGNGTFSNRLAIGANTFQSPSSALEINSTTGTLLLPRLSTSILSTLSNPLNGMMAYNTGTHNLFYYGNNTWRQLLFNDQNASSTTLTETFEYIGQPQNWVVPAGVTSLTIEANGAAGATSYTNSSEWIFQKPGGNGGRVTATLAVTPGQTLQINVGGSPNVSLRNGGYNGGGDGQFLGSQNFTTHGGGGGGATDIRIGGTNLSNRILVAGGGGGGPFTAFNLAGYCGGGLTACGNANGNVGFADQATAGLGAALGQGGSCGLTTDGLSSRVSGGGGGGYYGGGSNCTPGLSDGGGGGSSYTDPTVVSNVVHTQGINAGHGSLKITYTSSNRQNPYLDGANFSNIPASAIVGGNLTQQGNTFNGINQLVKTDGSGKLPVIDASNLTNLNASNISSGTLADARLTANVTLLGNTFNGNNQLVQLNGTGGLPSLNASNLTNLNASKISSGTLADARLTANVTLLGNTFNGNSQLVQTNAAGLLPALDGSNLTNLTINNLNGIVPPTKGGTGTNTTFTTGSVVFAGASGNYAQSNSNLFFDNTNNRLGIGTNTPDANLHINGSLKIQNGSQGTNKVLTSDANGVATWTNPSRTRSIFYDPQSLTNDVNPVLGGGIGIVKVTGSSTDKPSVQFLDNNQAGINLNFPVPSDWNGTSAFTVKLYSTYPTNTSGNFYFEYSTSYVTDGGSIDASGDSGTLLVNVTNGDELKQKVSSISFTPTPSTSMIQFKLVRYGSHASDTAGGNFNLLGIKIEYLD